MKKAVVIIGPTAVGKTSLAVNLAKKYDGVLISADSVQVFKKLDVISGKDKDELEGLDYHLIDVVSPEKSFSVSQFEKKAKEALNSTDKLPIIVGGTGLYVKSIIDGIDTSSVRPNLKLRAEFEDLSLEKLQNKLKDLDTKIWSQMNESDRKNKRRLIRKIEILMNGKWQMVKGKKREMEFLQIGLEIPRDKLRKAIDKRVEDRLKMGALKEAESLFGSYDKLTQQVKDANGYRQLFEHLLGKTTLEEAIEKWKLSEYKHAKNQMTWFKKDKRILWFNAGKKGNFEAIYAKICEFLG